MSKSNVKVRPSSEALPFEHLAAEHDTPLFVLDLDKIRQQFRALSSALPDVELYYAIKSLPNVDVVAALRDEGAKFDIATTGEIEMIRPLGLNPRHTLHSHPMKRRKDIQAALRFGCTTFVVDNIDELEKFRPFRHRVGLLIRVGFKNPNAVVDLARKFGCPLAEVSAIIDQAEEWGIHIKGLSFHVGSQCENAEHHAQAIHACDELIRSQWQDRGRVLSILDIGGGFPGAYSDHCMAIDEFCAPIRDALAALPERVRVLAEPGRFISSAGGTSIARVMGKARRSDGKMWYFLDDGVYGSYSGVIFDHANYPITVFSDSGDRQSSVLSGPTCDSIDVICEDAEIPELEIGDLVVGEQMGAYTVASATDFNLFDRAKIITVDSTRIEHCKIA